MAISTLNRVKTLTLLLEASTGNAIIPIYSNTNLNTGDPINPNYTVISVNCFLKNLKAFAKITSLPEISLPDFELTDSETTKLYKTLNVEWGSARKQLNLFVRSDDQNWSLVGSVSLLNPSGYPFRVYSLMDLLTDALAFELGSNSGVGVQIQDVGYGTLAGSDVVTIHGSYVEEIFVHQPDSPAVIINTGASGSEPPPEDYSLSNSTYIDNSFSGGN